MAKTTCVTAHSGDCETVGDCGARLSSAAYDFVPGSREHVLRPLSAPGVLSSEQCIKFTNLRPVCKVTERIHVWKEELKDDFDKDFLIHGLSEGFDIVDSTMLPPAATQSNYKSTAGTNKLKVEKRIVEELHKGNYVLCGDKPLVTSALGAIPKGLDDIRLIHDLSRPNGGVNKFAWDTSVIYTTLDQASCAMSPGCFLAKLDLQAAYRSIPINPTNYCMTGLRWRFEQDDAFSYFVDTKLPFGAAKSCQTFQRLSGAIVRMMARRNLVIFSYIDDMLCMADTEVECLHVFNVLLELIEDLGLLVNWKKVELPVQQIDFLGVHVDTVKRKLSLPECKLQELVSLIDKWTRKRRTTKLELQKFIGKLTWACRVIRGGRTFVRRLHDLAMRLTNTKHHIRVNAAARADISWWSQCLCFFQGTCSFLCDMPLPNFTFSTDACLVGGGAHFLSDWCYCCWEKDFPEYASCHINILELLSVLVALRRWAPLLTGQHVLIRTDNMTAMSVLNKSSSRSTEMMPILREIFWLSVRYDFLVSSVYLPGDLNVLADRISRLNEFESFLKVEYFLFNEGITSSLLCEHMSSDACSFLQEQWMQIL